MDTTNVSRVLRLFRLTVPPVFFMLACYVFLGEHVFGLAYVVGKRLKPRMRATLRGFYHLSTATFALGLHLYMLFACGDTTASMCPPVRLKERQCLAITSATALYCGATLLAERWANPMLDLQQPTGFCARASAAAGLAVTWICIADQQLCAQLLLLLFTGRRIFARFPAVDLLYGHTIKTYTLLHMIRILTDECEAIKKLAVATVAAMTVL